MKLQVADPSSYPFGMLSIYYREFGYSIAEDAAKLAVPKELDMTYPIYDDNTYFDVLKTNYDNAINAYVEKHTTEAALHRAAKYFMADVQALKLSRVTPSSNYAKQLMALSWEPVDPETGARVCKRELAHVVSALRADLASGSFVPPMSYRNLLTRYPVGHAIEPSTKDLAKFTDLSRLVETALELDGPLQLRAAEQKLKDELMNFYLDKILAAKYPELTPVQYEQAKQQQYLRKDCRLLEEKIFTMWKNGYLTLPATSVSLVDQNRLKVTPPMDQPPPAASAQTESFFGFHRLSPTYVKMFMYAGGTYRTPLEYGQRKALRLFSPLADDVKTKDLAATIAEKSLPYLKDRLRRLLYTFFLDRCKTPYMWAMINYPETIEWKGNAGLVRQQWLTAMYNAVKAQAPKPAQLDKPLVCHDLTKNPLLFSWFQTRIAMWKPVSVKHRDLFLRLTRHLTPHDKRFPTHDEKQALAGCDEDVWWVILAQSLSLLRKRSALEVYNAILEEIGGKLPMAPTVANLSRSFEPIYRDNPLLFDSVKDMTASLLPYPTDVAVIILWLRFLNTLS